MTYIQGQDACGLKAGDQVRVTSKAERGERGWKNDWVSSMDSAIGRVFTIDRFYAESGIGFTELMESGGNYLFPFFVLEKVKPLARQKRPEQMRDLLRELRKFNERHIGKYAGLASVKLYDDKSGIVLGLKDETLFHFGTPAYAIRELRSR